MFSDAADTKDFSLPDAGDSSRLDAAKTREGIWYLQVTVGLERCRGKRTWPFLPFLPFLPFRTWLIRSNGKPFVPTTQ